MVNISAELTDKVNKRQIHSSTIQVRDAIKAFETTFSRCLKLAFLIKKELNKVYELKVNIDTAYSALEILVKCYEEYVYAKSNNHSSKQKTKFKFPYCIVWFLVSTMALYIMMWGSSSSYGVDSFVFGFLCCLATVNCILFIGNFVSNCTSLILFLTSNETPGKDISLDTLKSRSLESLDVLNKEVSLIIHELEYRSVGSSAIAKNLDELTKSVKYFFSI